MHIQISSLKKKKKKLSEVLGCRWAHFKCTFLLALLLGLLLLLLGLLFLLKHTIGELLWSQNQMDTAKWSEGTTFCTQVLLFNIFVCSRYRPWATIRLLHHFGFVMCVNSRLYCTHFSCHWRKIRNVSCQLTQISERQHDPCSMYSLLLLNWNTHYI